MDVETAKAQLALAETEAAYLEAKSAFQADQTAAKKKAFKKAQAALVAARDDWRENHRTPPDGPGDGTVAPAPVEASLEVK